MRKALIFGTILVVLSLPVVLVGVGQGGGKEVQVVEVEDHTIERDILASGRLRFREEAEIKSEVLGRVAKLPIEEGDEVEEGELLMQIDDLDSRTSLSLEQERLRRAKLETRQQRFVVERLEKEFERSKRLLKQSVINERDFEDAKYEFYEQRQNLKVLQQAESVTELQVEQAQQDLDEHKVRAPFSGTVTELNVSRGEIVSGSDVFGDLQAAVVIAAPDSVYAQAFVGEANRGDVEVGQEVTLFPATHDDQGVAGEITAISYVARNVEGQQGKYFPVDVRIDSEARGGLYGGVSARAEILVEQSNGGATVPAKAVMEGGSGGSGNGNAFVFVWNDGIAERREIELGVRDDLDWEVRDGLDAGERVISGPHDVLRELRDGDSVRQ